MAVNSDPDSFGKGDWPTLEKQRWADAKDDPTPAIEVAKDWREAVANLPHDAYVRWQCIREEILAETDGPPTALQVREAGRQAASEMGIEPSTK